MIFSSFLIVDFKQNHEWIMGKKVKIDLYAKIITIVYAGMETGGFAIHMAHILL